MYFDSFSALIEMDGHGRYVWMAYGIFVLVLAFNLWLAFSSRAEAKKQVMRALRRAEQGAEQSAAQQTRAPTEIEEEK